MLPVFSPCTNSQSLYIHTLCGKESSLWGVEKLALSPSCLDTFSQMDAHRVLKPCCDLKLFAAIVARMVPGMRAHEGDMKS